MLESLYLKDFLLITESRLEFSHGMTVLTGETGAGKSILINAISLVLGARGSSDLIRKPAAKAEIQAEFDVSRHQAILDKLNQLEIDNSGELILRRILNASGKSKAFINEVAVTLNTVKEIGSYLVAIYGQHTHQALSKTDFQRQCLDGFAGVSKQVNKFTEQFHALQELKKQKQVLLAEEKARADRLELLTYQLAEFSELNIKDNEYEELNLEQKQLAQAESTAAGLMEIYQELTADETSLVSRLQNLNHTLAEFGKTYPGLRSIIEMLDAATIQIQEVSNDIRNNFEKIEVNPDRLSKVDSRLDKILALARKHQVNSQELINIQAKLQSKLTKLQNDNSELATLDVKIKELDLKLSVASAKLSKKRQAAAAKLQKMVSSQIHSLGMQGATFKINIEQGPISHFGQDRIDFVIETNPGQGFSPVGATASGGELSRIGLAIQVCLTQDASLPVMIFDEVDAGIGGATAGTVGKLLNKLAAKVQILCVTHLSQVATRANRHFMVSKKIIENNVLNEIKLLDKASRVEEIARMLGGKSTDKALQHARELLEA